MEIQPFFETSSICSQLGLLFHLQSVIIDGNTGIKLSILHCIDL